MALNLVQVVAQKTDALRLLEESYNARTEREADQSIVLESMLETARAKGFSGSLELAVGLLQASGRFHVRRGPVGKWQAVRQSTALVPVVAEPRRTALVPRDNGQCRALIPIPGQEDLWWTGVLGRG